MGLLNIFVTCLYLWLTCNFSPSRCQSGSGDESSGSGDSTILSGDEEVWPCQNVGQMFSVLNNCSSSVGLSIQNLSLIYDNICGNSSILIDVADCMDSNVVGVCTSDSEDLVNEWNEEYINRFCAADSLLEVFENSLSIIGEVLSDDGSCITENTQLSLDTCSQMLTEYDIEKMADLESYDFDLHNFDSLLTLTANNILKCVSVQLRHISNCSSEEINAYLWHYLFTEIPWGVEVDTSVLNRTDFTIKFEASSSIETVTVHGNNHISQYQSAGFYTYSPSGWTRYAENDYLSLIIYNEPVGNYSTEMKEFHIVLRGPDGAELGVYTAEGGLLPASFVSGQSSVTDSEGGIAEVLSSDHEYVIIIYTTPGIIIVIGKHSEKYVALSLTLSEALGDDTFGLMFEGFLEETSTVGSGANVSYCESNCSSLELAYRDLCIFDCVERGDEEIAMASHAVLEGAMSRAELLVAEWRQSSAKANHISFYCIFSSAILILLFMICF